MKSVKIDDSIIRIVDEIKKLEKQSSRDPIIGKAIAHFYRKRFIAGERVE